MSNNRIASVRCALSTLTSAFLIAAVTTGASRAEDCQTALGGSTGFVSLSNAGTTSQEKKVDEWSGEVIKIRTSLPGVLTLGATGARSQTSLYGKASSGSHPLLDSTRLGTGVRELQSIVRAGDHCIQVVPPPGVTTGDLRIDVLFTDVCHLGEIDDHGDSFVCASAITVGGTSVSGEITSTMSTDDLDIFTFELSAAATVSIESAGSTDVEAGLYESDGDLLESDDDSGSSTNFLIVRALSAGRYYVRVEGADGAYSVGVVQTP